jgi:gamma-glutamyl-gamma-aminobutyraldehyde dehydrogenase
LQVLPGDGPSVGEPLGLHMDVDMVSFTGSTETGRRFLRYAADSNLKKVVLECGGKNPAWCCRTPRTSTVVAGHVVNAAFWNMGENCSANSRLIVHKDVKDALMERIVARHAGLEDRRSAGPGAPSRRADRRGSLQEGRGLPEDRQEGHGSRHRRQGQGPLRGRPRSIDGVKPGDKLAREEIFGPILSVIDRGLPRKPSWSPTTPNTASRRRSSPPTPKALRAARAIRAGTVTVNCYGEGDISTPFGGYKQSGFGGRDNGIHAHDQYTELKTIWIDLSDPAPGDNVA